MGLAAVAIKAAKGRDKPCKITDGDGLFLYVTPSGGRYWRMNNRYLGKQKALVFGVWPGTGPTDAREQRDAARKLLARGEDPGERIKLDRISATVLALPNQRWSLDFVHDQLATGRRFRTLNIVDDVTHECLRAVLARQSWASG